MSIEPTAPGAEVPVQEASTPVVTGQSWQLSEYGLLAFERAAGPEGPAQVLFSQLELCSEPECSCREIIFRAVAFDSGQLPDPDDVGSMFDGDHAMVAQIDLDTGLVDRVQMDDGRPPLGAPLSDDWIVYLRSQVDGELLDLLHQRWLRAKGLKPREAWNEIDWSERDPDQLVIWEEIFPDDRVDHFLFDDRVFFAGEHYCKKTGCSCQIARVVFNEIVGPSEFEHLGSVSVDLAGGTLHHREASRRNAKALEVLWTAFQRRHRVEERLKERHRRVQELGRALPQPTRLTPAAAPRIGRNDPCPCGSGKKYKRCCLAAS